MAIAPFLAMTAAEMYAAASLPPKIAWMACHFSPYGLGLSNLPKTLSPGSLLIVDDITPPHGHDPRLITQQLAECTEAFQCCGVLLDFQRGDDPETQVIAKHLAAALPCSVIVSDWYASELDCGVFLPPVPPSESLEEHLRPWNGREIWLELGLDGEMITLTESGASFCPLPGPDVELPGFPDESLFCHYSVRTNENSAEFTIWRTKEDLMSLLEEAESLGIAGAVGLFQELGK